MVGETVEQRAIEREREREREKERKSQDRQGTAKIYTRLRYETFIQPYLFSLLLRDW